MNMGPKIHFFRKKGTSAIRYIVIEIHIADLKSKVRTFEESTRETFFGRELKELELPDEPP